MRYLAAFTVLVLSALVLNGASVDYFLKIEGIDGESLASGHEGSIELYSFSWGVSNPSRREAGSGIATGRRTYEPIRFIKRYDKASPILAKHCATGKHIAKATITLRRGGSTGRVEDYYTIQLEDCFITSVVTTDSEDLDKDGFPDLVEVCTLNFTKITWTHIPSKTTESDAVR